MSQVHLSNDDLNNASVEDLLNMDIEQISEVQGFERLPTAVYRLEIESCGLETVGKEDKQVIQVKLKVLECVELENPEDEASIEGREFPLEYTENFFLDAKDRFGLKAFRTVFKEFAAERELQTVGAIMEALPTTTGQALITKRTSKNKETGELNENNNIDMGTGFIAD